ncbi:unnamed protein product [Leptidea sinapis]|uniref:Uncharacterized protein n=1 Tax=Leptidea sinapis TaxID=189913 RepID=A0A5E4QLS5_9NEOP|nr:unnamed protein product [Leptidea sinapis]
MTSQIPLKSDCDITNAVEIFNKCVQSAAWEATPTVQSDNDYIPTYPQIVVDLVQKRDKLGRRIESQDLQNINEYITDWSENLKIR